MLLSGASATIASLQFLIFADGFFHVEGRIGFGGTQQEWGYVTVRPCAKMFWWLYHTTSKNVTGVYDKPLLIWLSGGPGGSSTCYGNFDEIGPLDLDLNPRNFTWVNDYNVLFIDNPVGTGYSYTEINNVLARDNAQIASDLLQCIRGFYDEIPPQWLNVPVYITSESYGGKMAVEFALVWEKAQKAGNITSNLQGVLLINPWISPITSTRAWATYLFNTGIVDTDGFNEIEEAAMKTQTAVDNEDWTLAMLQWVQAQLPLHHTTGNVDFYNILHKVNYPRIHRDESASRVDSLMNNEVKKALNLSVVTWGNQTNDVFSALRDDFMRPATNIVERLLNETDIEVYVIASQLDLLVPTPGTVKWVENLNWRNSTEWHNATRNIFVIDSVIEGYVKQYRTLKLYWINRSGHMVPQDSPAAIAAILQHLTASGEHNQSIDE